MLDKRLLLSKMAYKGYTIKKLSELVGISKNALSSKLNGKTTIKTDEVKKICIVLGIDDPVEKSTIFLS